MRRTLLLLAAVLVAAFGTSLVYLYVHGADTRASNGQIKQGVLVAAKLIPADTPAGSLTGQTRSQQIAADSVVPNAISDLTSVTGKVLKYTVPPGEQLTTDMFGAAASGVVPAGDAAVSVTIPAPADRVASMLKAGDSVNVYTVDKKGKLSLLLPDAVKVHLLGGGAGVDPSVVTFVLPKDEAVSLAQAQAGGAHLVLLLVR